MRDDFSRKTVELLAKRAGNVCSNPNCRRSTFGAAADPDKWINIGSAAHITAAAPGGPRYDPLLTPQQRCHHSNGIWLCATDAKIVDSDATHFTVEKLHEWKKVAEQRSFLEIVTLTPGAGTVADVLEGEVSDEFIRKLGLSAGESLDSVTVRVLGAAKADIEAFKRMASWPSHAVELHLRMIDGSSARPFAVSALATATRTFNEIVVVAPPGTGKTTTLLQMAEAALSSGDLAALFVPLGEWSSQAVSLFQSILGRNSFIGIKQEFLTLLAHAGRMVLIMDGWNELDASSRKRASAEIKALQREFPGLSIIISTRRQALDVPVSGPVVEIDMLDEDQQLEIARALRSSDGAAILDHAWRTPGVRELVAIPLYLTTLLARAAGTALPTTKEEVLRLFVEEHERPSEKAVALREAFFGFHTDVLKALAVEATRRNSTALSEDVARSVIKSVEDRLLKEGQISSAPQPTAILDVLVSHHLLVRAGGVSAAISFQHQQFQEWYASFEVETLMRVAATNKEAEKRLRVDVLNEYAWEEPVLFACERASRADESGAQAVAETVLRTIEIDPMLAAEMIYRSSDAVWKRIEEPIKQFIGRWHEKGKVDRAVRFMITTGRGDFAADMWELVSSPDDQIYLETFRIARRFRPSVLGPDIEDRIAKLPEEQREHVLSEIVMESGIDGIKLAAQVGKSDASPKVQTAVIEALQFRRADLYVSEILKGASDEVWAELAKKGYAGEILDAEASIRLRKERKKIVGAATDPAGRLRELLNAAREGESAGSEVGNTIENVDFPVKDQHSTWLVADAYKVYPAEVASALVHRLEAGLEIPYRSEELLQASQVSIDEGPLVSCAIDGKTPEKIAIAASVAIGPQTIGKLIDILIPLSAEVRNREYQSVDAIRERYNQVEARLRHTDVTRLVTAVLQRSNTTEPHKIGELARLLSRHGRHEEGRDLRISGVLHQELVTAVGRWGETLLASPLSTRSQLADVAEVIERLAAPELVSILSKMLVEDLIRWRACREEFLAQLKKGVRINSDAQTCYRLQYRRALVAIGNEAVTELMKSYLADFGFYGFGSDAAIALREIWDRRHESRPRSGVISWPVFGGVDVGKVKPHSREDKNESSPFADAILKVVHELSAAGSGEEARNHALELASIAFAMPYGDQRELIEFLLSLPQPLRAKQKLLASLASTGMVVSAEMVVDGLKSLLEERKKKQWFSIRDDWWEFEQWLNLLPFSDRPSAVLDALELLGPHAQQPWHLRGLLSGLGFSASPDGEQVLKELPRKYPAFFKEYDWLRALERRGPAFAARIILEFLMKGSFSSNDRGLDSWTLARKIAAGIQADAAFRSEVYRLYAEEITVPGREILEHAISETADKAGVLVLIRTYAKEGKSFSGSLRAAIKHVAVGERPSDDWVGAKVVFSVETSELRRELFQMINGDAALSKLAVAALTAIDELRDGYGPAESEPRHPDIESGRPWPIV